MRRLQPAAGDLLLGQPQLAPGPPGIELKEQGPGQGERPRCRSRSRRQRRLTCTIVQVHPPLAAPRSWRGPTTPISPPLQRDDQRRRRISASGRRHSMDLGPMPLHPPPTGDDQVRQRARDGAASEYSIVRPAAGGTDRRSGRQYESDEMTSPLALVPSAHQVLIPIDDLMKCTLPSANRTLAPPGCRLLAFSNDPSSQPDEAGEVAAGERILGGAGRHDRVDQREAAVVRRPALPLVVFVGPFTRPGRGSGRPAGRYSCRRGPYYGSSWRRRG